MAQAERAPAATWPRLMREPIAASYLSIGVTMLRAKGPEPKRFGARVLYDIRDLDRWADRLGGQPMDDDARANEAAEVERRFLEQFGAKE